jgi:3-hydroxyisobutyrate dehydrogenase-like beta-hydroxyacid dehydrogenase
VLTSSAPVCIVGFGESGGTVGAALAQRGYAVRAWDRLLEDPAGHDAMRARMEHALVQPAPSLADAVRGAKLVVCCVGAQSGAALRRDVAAMLVPGQALLDLDNAAPELQLATLGFAYDPAMRQTAHRGELP